MHCIGCTMWYIAHTIYCIMDGHALFFFFFNERGWRMLPHIYLFECISFMYHAMHRIVYCIMHAIHYMLDDRVQSKIIFLGGAGQVCCRIYLFIWIHILYGVRDTLQYTVYCMYRSRAFFKKKLRNVAIYIFILVCIICGVRCIIWYGTSYASLSCNG